MPISKALLSNKSIAARERALLQDNNINVAQFQRQVANQRYNAALTSSAEDEWARMRLQGNGSGAYLAYLDKTAGAKSKRPFVPIDNYIYLYHTNALIILPQYPRITDSTPVGWSTSTALGRSAPIYSYTGSGPRSMQIDIEMHRESMNQMNYTNSNSQLKSYFKPEDDYVDVAIRLLQAAALPNYAASQKMVDPPLVACRFGKDIYIKGIINTVGVSYDIPILRNDKFARVSVSFSINEVDAYDASMVEQIGSYRDPGDIVINTTLDNEVYTTPAPTGGKRDQITTRVLRDR